MHGNIELRIIIDIRDTEQPSLLVTLRGIAIEKSLDDSSDISAFCQQKYFTTVERVLHVYV